MLISFYPDGMFNFTRNSPKYAPVHCLPASGSDGLETCETANDRDSEESATLTEELQSPYSERRKNSLSPRAKLILHISIVPILLLTIIIIAYAMSNPINTTTSRYTAEEWHNVTHVSSSSKTNNKPHLCGSSAAEARARGCKWDQLNWAWLPPNCPSYSNDLFMSAEEKPWVFYEDIEQTRVVGEEAWERVLDGELRVFGERREHMTHCVYLMLSVAQIVRDGTPYIKKLAEYEHMDHCAELILKRLRESPDWGVLETFAPTVSFDQHCEGSRTVRRAAVVAEED